MKLRYTPEAIADIREIKTYIHDSLHNPNAAKRISKMILDHCAQLKVFPKMGVDLGSVLGVETDIRMLVRENYVAIYRCDHDMVSVSRVFNAKQDFLRLLFGADAFDRLNETE